MLCIENTLMLDAWFFITENMRNISNTILLNCVRCKPCWDNNYCEQQKFKNLNKNKYHNILYFYSHFLLNLTQSK